MKILERGLQLGHLLARSANSCDRTSQKHHTTVETIVRLTSASETKIPHVSAQERQ